MKAALWTTVLLTGLMVATSAAAADKGKKAPAKEPAAEEGAPAAPSPDEVTTGEARITMNAEYAKLRVDGEEWEEHEFLDNGRTVIIHTLNRLAEHRISLTPATSSDLAAAEIVIKPEDWKLATIARNEKMWRVERKVTFPKAAKPAGK